MSNYVYLISEKTLKEGSVVNNNVDEEYIFPSIKAAQEEGLQGLIGTRLLRKIQSIVEDGSIETLSNYKLLLDEYITNYLINKTQSELVIAATYKIRNAGVVQNSDGQNYQQTSIRDLQWLKETFENKAKFFANRLQAYLFAHTSQFPEFLSSDCYQIKAKKHNYSTGIYLGRSKKRS